MRGRNLQLAAKVAGSGLPAYQISSKAGMTPSRFSWILNGRVLPSEKEQNAIARALKTVKESLFE
jgi:transcriptional regulator with XRE-family HTH domain